MRSTARWPWPVAGESACPSPLQDHHDACRHAPAPRSQDDSPIGTGKPARLHSQSYHCIIIPTKAEGGQRVGGLMGARVAVAGASGYAGGELLRLLAGHPDLELGAVTAESNAGRPIAELHPHLAGPPSLAPRTFHAAHALATPGCDLALLALPAGQSARLAGDLRQGGKL